METRKLWGKHHRTNILHISQRIGIIVIVVTTKYNPNCTPSNIKKIWSWQSQTDEISTIFWMLRWRPNPTRSPGPLQRSFESYCGRWSDSMSFDEVWKEVGLSENGLSMNIPNLFSIGNVAVIFRPGCAPGFKLYPGFRVSQFPPQDLEKSSTRISSVRLILCHEGCLFRQNPSILLQKRKIWKIWHLKLTDINSGLMSTLD